MDPQSAERFWNINPEPVQTQPQWQSTAGSSDQEHPRAVVPLGLCSLLKLEEVFLQDGGKLTFLHTHSFPETYKDLCLVFYSKSFQTLFKINRKVACCSPMFNMMFQDPNGRDVVSLYKESRGCCCRGELSRMRIDVLHAQTIGYVKISTASLKMHVSIETHLEEPVFMAELPLPSGNALEILNINGSCPVAKIIHEQSTNLNRVVFRFPMDMDATMKTLILAAFVYMRYKLFKLLNLPSDYSDWGNGGYNGKEAWWRSDGDYYG